MALVSNPHIEALIDASPDDERLYLVYADWLQLEGDPRGELIALQCAASRTEIPSTALTVAMHEAIRPCEQEIVAITGGLVEPRDLLAWRFGFVHHMQLRLPSGLTPPVREALDALQASGTARFLSRISLHSTSRDFTEIVEYLAIIGWPRALRELVVVGSAIDLSAAARAFPRLIRIHAWTHGVVFRASFPSLQQLELTVDSAAWSPLPGNPLFPELRRLSIDALRQPAVEFCRALPRLRAQVPKLERLQVRADQRDGRTGSAVLGSTWQGDMRGAYGSDVQLDWTGAFDEDDAV